MSDYITIYLIRHARQSSSLCNVNVELSKEGIMQSELLAERLQKCNIKKVYSSDLIRAVETADIIRKYNNLENDIDDTAFQYADLEETDFGELTGLEDELLRVKYADYYKARYEDRLDLRIPGGENGEEVCIRMQRAINKIIDEAIENNYDDIAVVSHGGAIRCFLAGVLGMSQGKRFLISKNMENTAITELRVYKNEKIMTVERINDYSHLYGHEKLLRKFFKNI
ncbi:MAG: histidine phosphatase family protein [Lachnospiraceae bacterium]|nr:histidine phosphatase family protein [Lachnospiraceae bacterium]